MLESVLVAGPAGAPAPVGCFAGKLPTRARASTALAIMKHQAVHRQVPGRVALITSKALREPSWEPTVADARPHRARSGVRSIRLTSRWATVSDIERRQGSPSHRGDQRLDNSECPRCGKRSRLTANGLRSARLGQLCPGSCREDARAPATSTNTVAV